MKSMQPLTLIIIVLVLCKLQTGNAFLTPAGWVICAHQHKNICIITYTNAFKHVSALPQARIRLRSTIAQATIAQARTHSSPLALRASSVRANEQGGIATVQDTIKSAMLLSMSTLLAVVLAAPPVRSEYEHASESVNVHMHVQEEIARILGAGQAEGLLRRSHRAPPGLPLHPAHFSPHLQQLHRQKKIPFSKTVPTYRCTRQEFILMFGCANKNFQCFCFRRHECLEDSRLKAFMSAHPNKMKVLLGLPNNDKFQLYHL